MTRPTSRDSISPLGKAAQHLEVLERVEGLSDATVAVPSPAQALVLAALAEREAAGREAAGPMAAGPMVVIVPTSRHAEQLSDDIRAFSSTTSVSDSFGTAELDDSVVTLPAWETLPFERVSPQVATMGKRLAVFWRLFGEGAPRPKVVVAPVRALMQRLAGNGVAFRPVTVEKGEQLDPQGLVAQLVSMGYQREPQVEHRGELAVRGGIIDVFPSTATEPVRIDLFGDEVDRLTVFDVSDQRSKVDVSRVTMFGCRELLATPEVRERAEDLIASEPWGRSPWERLARGETFDGMESWLPWLQPREELVTDRLPDDARVVVVEPRRIRDRALDIYEEEGSLAAALSATWGFNAEDRDAALPRLHCSFDRLLERSAARLLSVVPVAEGPSTPSVSTRSLGRVAGDPTRLAEQVTSLLKDGFSVTLCASSPTGAERLAAVLHGEGVSVVIAEEAGVSPGASIVVSALSAGFVLPSLRVAVFAESDVTGRRTPHRRARPRARPTAGFFDDLVPGNFVVHRQHGIARYGGMTTRAIAGTNRDYLKLEFRGSDRLYLPVDQIEAITPYSGGETPTLSKMGGAEWSRARAKARASASEIAQELVDLYRRRLQIEGHAFSPDDAWQHELASSFPYVETPDQGRAIAEVTADMEQPRPMDRLVCGDVGFGKTEVAVRAVFKAVQDGKQAAVLVPTTLLASQHHQTFSDRYSGFPVRVELLSRFLTPAQVRRVIEGLASGEVDVVIGTHRLLGEDVTFKRLGLLVIDEEQRFGVSHKERVKRLAEGIDVLTLTASPIPRTLEMALTGIRELSMVNTPPADRRPILTYVGEYDESAVSEAIRRELLREGQVFFVHNRVVDIEAVADRLRTLVPEARIAIAHGQMDEGSLEQVAQDFWDQRFDVLVCTTIIESGIDMAAVNTLVVDRADLLGLGQLHQIRGRVGRSNQRAYAYLFHPPDRVLTEQAYERLKTIGELADLGSGFKIAMRDLEIRGAGNILGASQSGHIAAVGYEMYVQLVAEAVAEIKGEKRPEPPSVSIDLPGDAHLPPDYVAAEDVRLDAYRRLAAATRDEQISDIEEEWKDRFGPVPRAAQGLLALARLRVECLRTGVQEISVISTTVGGARRARAKLSPVALRPSAQARLQRRWPSATYREQLGQLLIPLESPRPAEELRSLLADVVPSDQEHSTVGASG